MRSVLTRQLFSYSLGIDLFFEHYSFDLNLHTHFATNKQQRKMIQANYLLVCFEQFAFILQSASLQCVGGSTITINFIDRTDQSSKYKLIK